MGDVIIMEGVGESAGEESCRTGANPEVEQQLAPPLNTAGISHLLELPHHQTEDAPTTPVQPEPPDIASGLSHKVCTNLLLILHFIRQSHFSRVKNYELLLLQVLHFC